MKDFTNSMEKLLSAVEDRNGDIEVTIRIVAKDGNDEEGFRIRDMDTQEKLSRVNEKLDRLKEKYDEVKQEECKCDNCTEAKDNGFTYEEFMSVLEDRIDDLESKITNIDENVGTMMECIPQSFDMLEERIGCAPNTNLKKKSVEKIIDSIYDVNTRQHDEQLDRYSDLKGLLTDIKAIALENKQQSIMAATRLKIISNAKYGINEDDGKTTGEMIRDIYNMLLISKGSTEESTEKICKAIEKITANTEAASKATQLVLKDIYARHDAIEAKIDSLTEAVGALALRIPNTENKPAAKKTPVKK